MKRINYSVTFFVPAILLMLIFLSTISPAFSIPQVEKTTIKLYSDGYALVEHFIKNGRLETRIRLLGKPEYIIVKNEEGLPLDYKVENTTLIVFSANSSYVYVGYYTAELTEKEGAIWRIHIKTLLENLTVILPVNATLISVDPLPTSVKAVNNTLCLTFTTTPIVVEYTITLAKHKEKEKPGTQTPSETKEKEEAKQEEKTIETELMKQFKYILIAIPALGAVIILALLYYKKKSKIVEELSEEEEQIIEFLKERKRAYLSEIVNSLNIPKTTAWRKLRKLEEKGLIRVTRTSRGLLIELK